MRVLAACSRFSPGAPLDAPRLVALCTAMAPRPAQSVGLCAARGDELWQLHLLRCPPSTMSCRPRALEGRRPVTAPAMLRPGTPHHEAQGRGCAGSSVVSGWLQSPQQKPHGSSDAVANSVVNGSDGQVRSLLSDGPQLGKIGPPPRSSLMVHRSLRTDLRSLARHPFVLHDTCMRNPLRLAVVWLDLFGSQVTTFLARYVVARDDRSERVSGISPSNAKQAPCVASLSRPAPRTPDEAQKGSSCWAISGPLALRT